MIINQEAYRIENDKVFNKIFYRKHFYTKQIQIYMKSNVAPRPNTLIQNNNRSTI